jgi:hypothetical protein
MILRLTRIAELKGVTLGILTFDGMPRMMTLEPPWKDNEREVSCIPPGTYKAVRFVSPKHGTTFQLTNVPDRDSIEFHPGNSLRDTKGCILVGMKVTDDYGMPMLVNSDNAMKVFRELTRLVEEFDLTITE